MAKRFRASDETVNSYGYRILTDGIILDDFERNPIMLYMHNRPWRGGEDEGGVIGRWENIAVENGELLMDAVFDEEDAFAKKIGGKVERGFLNMCSIGVEPIEWSEDPAYLLPGQTRATVTKCRLLEVSIVDRGSNANSVVLYNKGQVMTLSDGGDCLLPLIQGGQPNSPKEPEMDIKELALAAGMDSNSTAPQLEARIKTLAAQAAKADFLEREVAAYKKKEADALALADDQLLEEAIQDNRINATEKEEWKLLLAANRDAARKTLNAMPKRLKLHDIPGKQGPKEGDTYSKLMKEGKLAALKANDPAEFKRLYKEEYGVDYVE